MSVVNMEGTPVLRGAGPLMAFAIEWCRCEQFCRLTRIYWQIDRYADAPSISKQTPRWKDAQNNLYQDAGAMTWRLN